MQKWLWSRGQILDTGLKTSCYWNWTCPAEPLVTMKDLPLLQRCKLHWRLHCRMKTSFKSMHLHLTLSEVAVRENLNPTGPLVIAAYLYVIKHQPNFHYCVSAPHQDSLWFLVVIRLQMLQMISAVEMSSLITCTSLNLSV